MAKNRLTAKKQTDLIHYLGAALWVIFGIFLILAACSSFRFGKLIFTDEGRDSEESAVSYELVISEGESAVQVGNELEKNGIIRSGLAFFVQTKLYDCTLPTGKFVVSSCMSSKEIAKYLGQEYTSREKEESE